MAKTKGSTSTKGIPGSLKDLATNGNRVRFAGGWLGDSEQDRFLADWIDRTPNAWGVMKFLLYNALKGSVIAIQQPEQPETVRDFDAAESAFLTFDD